MKPSGIITLLTDFGLQDPFVGVMKGVIHACFPDAQIIDLTHAITPHAIGEGAFWLERSYGWFPKGTTHVAVVDPGVGSERRALAARGDGHCFIGPDNGILNSTLRRAELTQVRQIDLIKLGLTNLSGTFHGRDVFARVAALLASWKLGFDSVGPCTEPQVKSALARPARKHGELIGEVVTIDHFGNALTNLESTWLTPLERWSVELNGESHRLCRTYSDAGVGESVGIPNSFGVLEIARREGNAARELGIVRGARVLARRI